MFAVSAVGALDLTAAVIVDLWNKLHVAQGIIAADEQYLQRFQQDLKEALKLRLTALVVAHLPPIAGRFVCSTPKLPPVFLYHMHVFSDLEDLYLVSMCRLIVGMRR